VLTSSGALDKENPPVEIALILYGVFAAVIVVACSLPQRLSVNYVWISRLVLDDFIRNCENLVVLELANVSPRVIPGALSVTADQMKGLLRWMPSRTTLVLCGIDRSTLCLGKIATCFRRREIERVYILEDGIWD
jgi:hypothetical protein